MFLPEDVSKYNDEVQQWADKTRAEVVAAVDAAGVKHSKNSPDKVSLQKSIKARTGKQFDVANKVAFSFNRSMVWVQKGVGRGHPVTNPRTAKDVFNGPVTKALDELAEIAAQGQGNLIVKSLLIK